MWDVEGGQSISSMRGGAGVGAGVGGGGEVGPAAKASGHRDSVYCLAMNSSASVMVSGSTERVSSHAIGCIRMWDPRTAQQVRRSRGICTHELHDGSMMHR